MRQPDKHGTTICSPSARVITLAGWGCIAVSGGLSFRSISSTAMSNSIPHAEGIFSGTQPERLFPCYGNGGALRSAPRRRTIVNP